MAIEALQPYLRMWLYELDHPELAEDFPGLPPGLADRLSKELPRPLLPSPPPHYLFVSPARAFTDLHVDPWLANVWFMQCEGEKVFELWHPRHFPAMCTRATSSAATPRKESSSSSSSSSSGGGLRYAWQSEGRQLVRLGAGDLLFLPAHWLHRVVTTAPSVTLSHNFFDGAGAARVALNAVGLMKRERAAQVKDDFAAKARAFLAKRKLRRQQQQKQEEVGGGTGGEQRNFSREGE